MNENNSINTIINNPGEFYNYENILSEDIISEYEEVHGNNSYLIRNYKITYENGNSITVTKKIVCQNNSDI